MSHSTQERVRMFVFVFTLSNLLSSLFLSLSASIFSDNMPETLHAALLYPCGFVLRGIWAVVKYFFDYKTRQKIHMLGSADDFKEFVDPENLIEEVGGTSTYKYDRDEFIESFPEVCHDPWLESEPEEEAMRS